MTKRKSENIVFSSRTYATFILGALLPLVTLFAGAKCPAIGRAGQGLMSADPPVPLAPKQDPALSVTTPAEPCPIPGFNNPLTAVPAQPCPALTRAAFRDAFLPDV